MVSPQHWGSESGREFYFSSHLDSESTEKSHIWTKGGTSVVMARKVGLNTWLGSKAKRSIFWWSLNRSHRLSSNGQAESGGERMGTTCGQAGRARPGGLGIPLLHFPRKNGYSCFSHDLPRGRVWGGVPPSEIMNKQTPLPTDLERQGENKSSNFRGSLETCINHPGSVLQPWPPLLHPEHDQLCLSWLNSRDTSMLANSNFLCSLCQPVPVSTLLKALWSLKLRLMFENLCIPDVLSVLRCRHCSVVPTLQNVLDLARSKCLV
jgi:hypothetical protein